MIGTVNTIRRIPLASVLVLALAVLLGCEPSADAEVKTIPEADGPLAVGLSVPAESIRTVDTLRVRLDISTQPGWVLTDPTETFRSSLESAGWQIRGERHEPPSRTARGGVMQTWALTLEPDLDGVYPIPSIEVTAREADGPGRVTQRTAAHEISVASVLDTAELTALESAGSPDAALVAAMDSVSTDLRSAAFPAETRLNAWWIGLSAAMALGLLLLIAAIVRRLTQRGTPQAGTDTRAALGLLKRAARGGADDPIGDASRGLRQIIGARVNRDGTALAADDIPAVLAGVTGPESAHAAAELVHRLEDARFDHSPLTDHADLAAQALSAAERLLAEEGVTS